MDKIRNVILTFWFKELDFNPMERIGELQKELTSIFDNAFMYNEEKITHLISMPRIQAMSKNHQYLFQMSLINASVVINVENLDSDEIILLINNNTQFFYDVLKSVYDLSFCYLSIKLELFEEKKEAAKYLGEKYHFSEEYEDFLIKRGFIKDRYYINYAINSGKEFNFDVKKDNGNTSQDILDRTFITSLAKAKLSHEFILKVIEINDRYAYNKDESYESSKDSIRGMIIELKDILNNKLYDKM